MELVQPSKRYVDGFVAALQRGWSPNTERDVSKEELSEVTGDVDTYLAGLDDRDPQGRTVTLADGSRVPRLPAFTRWMWDGEFCGSINARWQPGTTDLPPTCLGHVGYAVVPWKQRRGYATQALGQMLALVATETDLAWVAITAELDNVPSQRVITANGGVLEEWFDRDSANGSGSALRYRVTLRP